MGSTKRFVPYGLLAALLIGLSKAPSEPAQATSAAQGSVTVLAASSLTDSFKEIGTIFEANTGTHVDFSFNSSTASRVMTAVRR